MSPIQLFDVASSTFTYLLIDIQTRCAVLIDPVDTQIERDLAALAAHGVRLSWVIETHLHADHVTSASALIEHTGANAAVPAGCGIASAARQLNGGEVLHFGNETILSIHTPGHTAGSMSFLWRNHVFTGDTLLIDGCGRTDFQNGSADALYSSITQVLFALPADTLVWPGHDYHGRSNSTLAFEKENNSKIAGKSRAEFVTSMTALCLPEPARFDEATAANVWLGARHDADSMGDGLVRHVQGYAGDILPTTAYEWWRRGDVVLVDIRSDAEREWVGFVPDAVAVAWKQWPGMAISPTFDTAIQALAVAHPGRPLAMLCRSGVRSVASAKRATELGLLAFNILEGFEGDPNDQAKRSSRGGWKYRGLPWRQN
jgi:sulfur dioxygenase